MKISLSAFYKGLQEKVNQDPVVQSIVSLKCSLVVKMLTVLVSIISNSHVFLLKNVRSFCKCKSYSHFFSKNISIYAIFNDQSFNDMLTNDISSFEQLSPGNLLSIPNPLKLRKKTTLAKIVYCSF